MDRNFEADLSGAKIWEKRGVMKWGNRLGIKSCCRISDPLLQSEGIDVVSGAHTFEVKTRDSYHYKDNDKLDILIEIDHTYDDGTVEKGWIYKLRSDYLIYQWKNPFNTDVVDSILFYVTPAFLNWFESNKHRYPIKMSPTTFKNGRRQITRFRLVKLKDIPHRFYERLNEEKKETADDLWG
jgi:hypothetical protein